MTLQEAKDQVAYSDGFENWETFELWCCDPKYRRSDAIIKTRKLSDEAAELYARSKWDEACELQKQLCSDIYYTTADADKPEFNP